MKHNVGGVDRIVRLVVGVILVLAGFSLAKWWLMIIGGIVFLTGLMRFCGLYTLLGMSTCPLETPKQ
ncbi:MAG: DUF2892 domain-containing protein [Candidatus Moranbacteria bacterium]|nr:DUF2892 domain-containing protein [Candidatus Moranbacteria bacterium]OIQ03239.1 MAG: hypothetical protein AUK58_01920 [Candidatus Moranbacteria bacterium CG2_30_41_165]PIP25875.1 MAG: hypothetical protein COX32_01065 [Candidatus Moranbacteria bacterium CG23_combo_of_CG06-09_8_20_14_all_41_28]PIV86619.1 MAG: DUF2892 domain-containing protein [Candidatus Moranbacteria bacterium CG17_big_fil_post_rev_8_21_14_2_50_41_107]PIW93987.1 MAG: DUF2892 domain-containing protein [Candidatus Moranbacteri